MKTFLTTTALALAFASAAMAETKTDGLTGCTIKRAEGANFWTYVTPGCADEWAQRTGNAGSPDHEIYPEDETEEPGDEVGDEDDAPAEESPSEDDGNHGHGDEGEGEDESNPA